MSSTAELNRRTPNFGHGFSPYTIPARTFDDIRFTINMSPDPIGHGATANIYKGEVQENKPLVVAIKVFGHMIGPHQEQMLRRELRAASKVATHHRYIVAFLGTADVGQHKAIVSLYMKNGNLMNYLKTDPNADKGKLILQVAEAVNYIHTDAGLAHGDIKCDNVLVSDYGNALLTDFGLSTFLEDTFTRTMTSIRSMNTLPFAAPELLGLSDDDSAAPVPSKSRESDVYAFGMLILEAVTGRMPFSGLNSLAVMRRIYAGQHPSRPTANGFVAISSEWWNVCRSCWTFNPNDRPAMDIVLKGLGASSLLPKREIFLESNLGAVCSVAYMPCGRRVLSGSDAAIKILDITSGQHSTISDKSPPWPVVAVSSNGSQIAFSVGDYSIQRWNAVSGEPLGQPVCGHSGDIMCIAYSPDGTRIVSCSRDCTIRLWDASSGKANGNPLKGHTDWVRSVAFSPDSTRIVSASDDTTIRIWHAGSGEHLATFEGHSHYVHSVCYHPDGKFIVSGSIDDTVCIWDTETLQPLHTLQENLGMVLSGAVSPSGRYIASGSFGGTIRIWDADTDAPVGDPLTGHKDIVTSVAFSPDGRSLVSGSRDGTVHIWELFE